MYRRIVKIRKELQRNYRDSRKILQVPLLPVLVVVVLVGEGIPWRGGDNAQRTTKHVSVYLQLCREAGDHTLKQRERERETCTDMVCMYTYRWVVGKKSAFWIKAMASCNQRLHLLAVGSIALALCLSLQTWVDGLLKLDVVMASPRRQAAEAGMSYTGLALCTRGV